MTKYPNPWNLTPQQEATMDAICETGCIKLAARTLGISPKTIEAHVWRATERMGLSGSPGHLRKYVLWTEWRTRQKAQEPAR